MSDAPVRFDRYLRRAERLVGEPGKLKAVIAKAGVKLATSSNDKLLELKGQLELSLALVKDWLRGDYRHIELRTVGVLVAGLLYFVVPLDLVPDFLPGVGLLDDITVLGYVFAQLKNELAAYAEWRQTVGTATVEPATDQQPGGNADHGDSD